MTKYLIVIEDAAINARVFYVGSGLRFSSEYPDAMQYGKAAAVRVVHQLAARGMTCRVLPATEV